jgi:hypothetical protein
MEIKSDFKAKTEGVSPKTLPLKRKGGSSTVALAEDG